MTVAAKLDPKCTSTQSWAQICESYWDEWVCLVDVVDAADGSIHEGRVIGHDASINSLLDATGLVPGAVVTQTAGRRLNRPRIEMTDELRDLVRRPR